MSPGPKECAIARRRMLHLPLTGSPRIEGALRTHLLACAGCRRRLRVALTAGRAFGAFASAPPPDDRFFEQLEAEVVLAAGRQPRRHRRSRLLLAASLAAMFLVGVVLSGLRGEEPRERSSLLGSPPLAVDDVFVFDPSALTMPVHSGPFRGLRGLALMDEVVEPRLHALSPGERAARPAAMIQDKADRARPRDSR
ncbi:MAG: hypothetical protein AB7I19_16545 [Planctomycetota bacterium]